MSGSNQNTPSKSGRGGTPTSPTEGRNAVVIISEPTSGEKAEPHLPLDYTFDKFVFGVCYMCCMGVCGIVLVALGSTLEQIAEQCNTTSKAIGTVFLARGAGAILGAIVSAKLYEWFHGNSILALALLSIASLLIWVSFNTSVEILHICFFLLGVSTAITDTGSQIMTTKVHGRVAGPWMGANTVAFGISGAFVPFIELVTPTLLWENIVLAVFIVGVAITITVANSSRLEAEIYSAREYYEQYTTPNKEYRYIIEILIAFMVFCFIGGKVSATSYVTVYIGESGVVPVTQASDCIFVLWLAIAIGRMVGVYDQIFLTNETIRMHLSLYCIGGFSAMLLILRFSESSSAFYAGLAFYGLFNGPCVGYCYDLNNRLAGHTEASVSIVMLGINIGASLVPYFTTYLWNYDALGLGENTFVVVIMATMFIPLPVLNLIYCYADWEGGIHRIGSIHNLKEGYLAIKDEDDGDDETNPLMLAAERRQRERERSGGGFGEYTNDSNSNTANKNPIASANRNSRSPNSSSSSSSGRSPAATANTTSPGSEFIKVEPMDHSGATFMAEEDEDMVIVDAV